LSADLVNGRDRYRHQLGSNLKSSTATGSESLTELLDGLILLYHVGVHKHYLKVNHYYIKKFYSLYVQRYRGRISLLERVTSNDRTFLSDKKLSR